MQKDLLGYIKLRSKITKEMYASKAYQLLAILFKIIIDMILYLTKFVFKKNNCHII